MDFIANKTLLNFLPIAGFKRQRTDSEKLYYTNKDGNQLKIDLHLKKIAFINSNGVTKKVVSSVSYNELINLDL